MLLHNNFCCCFILCAREDGVVSPASHRKRRDDGQGRFGFVVMKSALQSTSVSNRKPVGDIRPAPIFKSLLRHSRSNRPQNCRAVKCRRNETCFLFGFVQNSKVEAARHDDKTMVTFANFGPSDQQQIKRRICLICSIRVVLRPKRMLILNSREIGYSLVTPAEIRNEFQVARTLQLCSDLKPLCSSSCIYYLYSGSLLRDRLGARIVWRGSNETTTSNVCSTTII